jgi:hypothetical protein
VFCPVCTGGLDAVRSLTIPSAANPTMIRHTTMKKTTSASADRSDPGFGFGGVGQSFEISTICFRTPSFARLFLGFCSIKWRFEWPNACRPERNCVSGGL